MSDRIYDLIIIGGGPAGLTSLIYALRGGINTILIESNPYGCGQISLTERVDNYPGLYGISGFDLGDKFIEHAASLGGTIVSDTASRIEKTNGGDFVVHTASSKEYKANPLYMLWEQNTENWILPVKKNMRAREYHIVPLVMQCFLRTKTLRL